MVAPLAADESKVRPAAVGWPALISSTVPSAVVTCMK